MKQTAVTVARYFVVVMATMTLTADLLMRISGAYDLELVTRLDLSGRGLRSLEGIAQCPNLTELDVSRNRIADLSPLGGLAASLTPATLHLQGTR